MLQVFYTMLNAGRPLATVYLMLQELILQCLGLLVGFSGLLQEIYWWVVSHLQSPPVIQVL